MDIQCVEVASRSDHPVGQKLEIEHGLVRKERDGSDVNRRVGMKKYVFFRTIEQKRDSCKAGLAITAVQADKYFLQRVFGY